MEEWETVETIPSNTSQPSSGFDDSEGWETVEVTNEEPRLAKDADYQMAKAVVDTPQQGQVQETPTLEETTLPSWFTGRKFTEESIANTVETLKKQGKSRQEILNFFKEQGATPLDMQNAAHYHAKGDIRAMPSQADYEIVGKGLRRGVAKPTAGAMKLAGKVIDPILGTNVEETANQAINQIKAESERDKEIYGVTNPAEVVGENLIQVPLVGATYGSKVAGALTEGGIEAATAIGEKASPTEIALRTAVGALGGALAATPLSDATGREAKELASWLKKEFNMRPEMTQRIVQAAKEGNVNEVLAQELRVLAQAGDNRANKILAEALKDNRKAQNNLLDELHDRTQSVYGFDPELDGIIDRFTVEGLNGKKATDWSKVWGVIEKDPAIEPVLKQRIQHYATFAPNDAGWQKIVNQIDSIEPGMVEEILATTGARTSVAAQHAAWANRGFIKLLQKIPMFRSNDLKAADIIAKSLERGRLKPKKFYDELVREGVPKEEAVKVVAEMQKEGMANYDFNSPEKYDAETEQINREWNQWQIDRAVEREYPVKMENSTGGKEITKPSENVTKTEVETPLGEHETTTVKNDAGEVVATGKETKIEGEKGLAVNKEYGEDTSVGKITTSEGEATIVKAEEPSGDITFKDQTNAPDQRLGRKDNLEGILNDEDIYKFESYRDSLKAEGKRPPYPSDLFVNSKLQEELGIEVTPDMVRKYYEAYPSRLNTQLPETIKTMLDNPNQGMLGKKLQELVQKHTREYEGKQLVDWEGIYNDLKKELNPNLPFMRALKKYIDTEYGIPKRVLNKYPELEQLKGVRPKWNVGVEEPGKSLKTSITSADIVSSDTIEEGLAKANEASKAVADALVKKGYVFSQPTDASRGSMQRLYTPDGHYVYVKVDPYTGRLSTSTVDFDVKSGKGSKFYNDLWDTIKGSGIEYQPEGLTIENQFRMPINMLRYYSKNGPTKEIILPKDVDEMMGLTPDILDQPLTKETAEKLAKNFIDEMLGRFEFADLKNISKMSDEELKNFVDSYRQEFNLSAKPVGEKTLKQIRNYINTGNFLGALALMLGFNQLGGENENI